MCAQCSPRLSRTRSTDAPHPPRQTFLLPETFAATLLLRRAARLRKVTGNPLLKTRTEIEAQFHPGVLQAGVNQVGLAFRLCVEPAIAFCDLYTGVVYACFYLCVFTSSSLAVLWARTD